MPTVPVLGLQRRRGGNSSCRRRLCRRGCFGSCLCLAARCGGGALAGLGGRFCGLGRVLVRVGRQRIVVVHQLHQQLLGARHEFVHIHHRLAASLLVLVLLLFSLRPFRGRLRLPRLFQRLRLGRRIRRLLPGGALCQSSRLGLRHALRYHVGGARVACGLEPDHHAAPRVDSIPRHPHQGRDLGCHAHVPEEALVSGPEGAPKLVPLRLLAGGCRHRRIGLRCPFLDHLSSVEELATKLAPHEGGLLVLTGHCLLQRLLPYLKLRPGVAEGTSHIDPLGLEVHGHELQCRHPPRPDGRQECCEVRKGGVARAPQPQPLHVSQVARLGGPSG
mmetsp:Transcript_3744/g.10809  ORF Transcript_3744/g.10809 Transcript_3744/m.10809 type:complete len:332 (+) Transcript_3744:2410-3405(+)